MSNNDVVVTDIPEEKPEVVAPKQEVRFQFPHVATEEGNQQQREILARLAITFGGCSIVPVVGAWKDPDMEVPAPDAMGIAIEPMLEVRVAVTEAEMGDLKDFANAVMRLYKQKALYMVGWNGEAKVLTVHYDTVH